MCLKITQKNNINYLKQIRIKKKEKNPRILVQMANRTTFLKESLIS